MMSSGVVNSINQMVGILKTVAGSYAILMMCLVGFKSITNAMSDESFDKDEIATGIRRITLGLFIVFASKRIVGIITTFAGLFD